MRIGGAIEYTVENGPGLRLSIFVSGCRRHCPGCHNEQLWSFDHGIPYDQDIEDAIMELLGKPGVQGISILGGEPFEPENEPALAKLVGRIRMEQPDKDVWVYTGGRFEDLTDKSLLKLADVLVDGEYVENLRDMTLLYRGSRNQRLVSVASSLSSGKVVLWREEI